jgi:hypothetical protein
LAGGVSEISVGPRFSKTLTFAHRATLSSVSLEGGKAYTQGTCWLKKQVCFSTLAWVGLESDSHFSALGFLDRSRLTRSANRQQRNDDSEVHETCLSVNRLQRARGACRTLHEQGALASDWVDASVEAFLTPQHLPAFDTTPNLCPVQLTFMRMSRTAHCFLISS